MDARFQTTHWSLVLAAGTGQSAESRVALEELCGAYWFPLYAFIRRQGFDAEDARDLTQAYFARLIEKRDLEDVKPELGRFRSFLLASVKHFISNELDRERARKRAPEAPLLSLDAADAEGRYRVEPVDGLTPEAVYERRWAATVLDRASERLRTEWGQGEKASRFESLRGYLTDDGPAPYRAVGETLGMSEDALKVAVHRLRRRFGALLREEIAATVREPADVDDEIRHLLAVLRS
ncbi:MAG TPA: sigma-70 family RNA polymerase sigma factor [Thermoanaerobaculia bacterium]|nr:sigma-70 family RNA polymerase sigma factor [Thermoanaerobaculia bacterium]